jgi:hypothetical protein
MDIPKNTPAILQSPRPTLEHLANLGEECGPVKVFWRDKLDFIDQLAWKSAFPVAVRQEKREGITDVAYVYEIGNKVENEEPYLQRQAKDPALMAPQHRRGRRTRFLLYGIELSLGLERLPS